MRSTYWLLHAGNRSSSEGLAARKEPYPAEARKYLRERRDIGFAVQRNNVTDGRQPDGVAP